jgi:hypothetical protein
MHAYALAQKRRRYLPDLQPEGLHAASLLYCWHCMQDDAMPCTCSFAAVDLGVRAAQGAGVLGATAAGAVMSAAASTWARKLLHADLYAPQPNLEHVLAQW